MLRGQSVGWHTGCQPTTVRCTSTLDMHSSAAAIDGSFSCTRSLASRPVDPLTVGRQCSEEYSTSALYVCDCFQSLNATWSALLSVAIVNGKRSLRAVVLHTPRNLRGTDTERQAGGRAGRQAGTQAGRGTAVTGFLSS